MKLDNIIICSDFKNITQLIQFAIYILGNLDHGGLYRSPCVNTRLTFDCHIFSGTVIFQKHETEIP